MKTIYDYDVTAQELDYLLIKQAKKEYVASATKQKILSDLYCLFNIRNNFEGMDKIEKSIQERSD
jgi:hypothetical protein